MEIDPPKPEDKSEMNAWWKHLLVFGILLFFFVQFWQENCECVVGQFSVLNYSYVFIYSLLYLIFIQPIK